MSWEHPLPLTITNASGVPVEFKLYHKQGDKGVENWGVSLSTDASGHSTNEQETSYSNHGDSWQGTCSYAGGQEKTSGGFHHWGVQEDYLSVSCIISQNGFTMIGIKSDGDSPSHHYFEWE